MPRESPLQACVDAGALALPQLLKLSTVLQGKYTEAWEAGSVPLDLRDEVPGGGPGGGGPGGRVQGVAPSLRLLLPHLQRRDLGR